MIAARSLIVRFMLTTQSTTSVSASACDRVWQAFRTTSRRFPSSQERSTFTRADLLTHVRRGLAAARLLDLIRPDQPHVPLVRRPRAGAGPIGDVGLLISGLEDDLVGVAVAAEMDDLGLVLVELAQQVDRPCTGDQDQLHRVAKRAAADLLVDLAELAGQIERCGPARVGGEEQDLDRLHPDLGDGAKMVTDVWAAV